MNSKIKLVQFITDMGDAGAETLVKDYVTFVDKEKFDVMVLVRYPVEGTANVKALNQLGIRIVSLNKKGSLLAKICNKLLEPVRMRRMMLKFLNDEKPDVIHVHLGQLKYIRAVADKLDHVKLLYTCHNEVSHYFGKKQKQEYEAAKYLIEHNHLQLIALHEDMKNELNHLFNIDTTVVMNNGINVDKFTKVQVDPIQKRKEIGIPEDAFVVGHVGRFMPQKNHAFLVEVFNELLKIKPNSFLLMIGAGDIETTVNQLKELGIHQYKILSNRSDVNELMSCMDYFVFPSIFEGLGIVAIEAQVSGLRCLLSDRVPKAAKITSTTEFLPLNNPKQWADFICSQTAQPTNNDVCLADWDIREVVRKLEAIYMGE